MKKQKLTEENVFPADFMWGASTASHQLEGGTYNQWSVWELENAKRQAKNAHKNVGWTPKWEDIKKQAEDPENYVSGDGVKHYELYKEDFKLLKKLNLNSFRFGVEWSRIEPEEGQWNEEALQHYRDYIEALLAQGTEPVLNLWHWENLYVYSDNFIDKFAGCFEHYRRKRT